MVPGVDKRFFPFFTASRLTVEPILPPTQWVPGSLPRRGGIKWQGVKPTTHLHLVSWLRMVELYLHPMIYLCGVVIN
jgi:hypothetical protein